VQEAHVITQAPRPVQVVVAYDFSPSAEQALARAVEVAARAPQHVLHIVAALDSPAGRFGHITYDSADRLQRVISERATEAFAGRPTVSEVQFYVHARIGKPAAEILAVAQEVGADLIFIGSHGKTGVERMVLGSVSEHVVREAGCPVMVARAKTYSDVELLRVMPYPHGQPHYTRPHRYSYIDNRAQLRPIDWPIP
jgi:nucleotide-binding universal stress UspA family protein